MRSSLVISPDPDEILDEAVLAAADVTIDIATLTPALPRKAIRRVTGGVTRGVTRRPPSPGLAVSPGRASGPNRTQPAGTRSPGHRQLRDRADQAACDEIGSGDRRATDHRVSA